MWNRSGDFVTLAAHMTPLTVYSSLKVVAYIVILSMVGTLAFAAVIALRNWSGIEV